MASMPARGTRSFGLGRGLDALIPGRDELRDYLSLAGTLVRRLRGAGR